jgi:hypothetical protein
VACETARGSRVVRTVMAGTLAAIWAVSPAAPTNDDGARPDAYRYLFRVKFERAGRMRSYVRPGRRLPFGLARCGCFGCCTCVLYGWAPHALRVNSGVLVCPRWRRTPVIPETHACPRVCCSVGNSMRRSPSGHHDQAETGEPEHQPDTDPTEAHGKVSVAQRRDRVLRPRKVVDREPGNAGK